VQGRNGEAIGHFIPPEKSQFSRKGDRHAFGRSPNQSGVSAKQTNFGRGETASTVLQIQAQSSDLVQKTARKKGNK
jgi:hypothetical protein